MTDAVIDQRPLDDKHFLAAAMAVVRRRRAWREAHQKGFLAAALIQNQPAEAR